MLPGHITSETHGHIWLQTFQVLNLKLDEVAQWSGRQVDGDLVILESTGEEVVFVFFALLRAQCVQRAEKGYSLDKKLCHESQKES